MGDLRLFFAVPLPEDVKRRIADLCATRGAEAPARWLRPAGYHLTLRFLGDTPEERMRELSSVLKASAARSGPIRAAFNHAGAFPSEKRARVLWLGVEQGSEGLRSLAAGLEEEVASLGFDREKRPFKAHLTVGRFRRPCFAGRWCGQLDPIEFLADRVVLYRSHLLPTGAEYEEMDSATLLEESRIELSSKEDKDDR